MSELTVAQAISAGDWGVVTDLVSAGADVEAPDENGISPLELAAHQGDSRALKLLLTFGARPDTAGPLHAAVLAGSPAAARLLLEAGARVDQPLVHGTTALMAAVDQGNLGMVRLLLAAGASPNAEDERDWSVLMYAAQEGRSAVVRALLEAGAEVDRRDQNGCTALMYACRDGDLDTVTALLAGGAQVQARAGWLDPLKSAALAGKADLVPLLVKQGTELDFLGNDSQSMTALMCAASQGHSEIVTLLLQAGADPAVATPEGLTALGLAQQGEHAEVVGLLGGGGAPPRTPPPVRRVRRGEQPPPQAVVIPRQKDVVTIKAEDGRWSSCRVLDLFQEDGQQYALLQRVEAEAGKPSTLVGRLQLGAFVTIEDPLEAARAGELANQRLWDREVPDNEEESQSEEPAGESTSGLVGAILEHDEDRVDQLLAQPGDLNACDAQGLTPLMAACLTDDFGLVLRLVKRRAEVNPRSDETPLGVAAAQNATAALKALLTSGAKVDHRMENNRTALMVAAEAGHAEMIELLLRARAAVRARDNRYWTALMYASREGRSECVRALLEAGSEVDARDDQEATALMQACLGGHLETLEVLLEAGADPALADSQGRTAALLARQAGHQAAFQRLSQGRGLAAPVEVLITSHLVIDGQLNKSIRARVAQPEPVAELLKGLRQAGTAQCNLSGRQVVVRLGGPVEVSRMPFGGNCWSPQARLLTFEQEQVGSFMVILALPSGDPPDSLSKDIYATVGNLELMERRDKRSMWRQTAQTILAAERPGLVAVALGAEERTLQAQVWGLAPHLAWAMLAGQPLDSG